MDLASMIPSHPVQQDTIAEELAAVTAKVGKLRDLTEEAASLWRQIIEFDVGVGRVRRAFGRTNPQQRNLIKLKEQLIDEMFKGASRRCRLQQSEAELTALTDPTVLDDTLADLRTKILARPDTYTKNNLTRLFREENPVESARQMLTDLNSPYSALARVADAREPRLGTLLTLVLAAHGRADLAITEMNSQLDRRISATEDQVTQRRRILDTLQREADRLSEDASDSEPPAILRPLFAQISGPTADIGRQDLIEAHSFLESAQPDLLNELHTMRARAAACDAPADLVADVAAANRLFRELTTQIVALMRLNAIDAQLDAILAQQFASEQPSADFTQHVSSLIALTEDKQRETSMAVNTTADALDRELSDLRSLISHNEA